MSDVYKYLFGPVPSRRLGRSLGVDLIPFKTCTMDCVYCQLGETTCEVSERGDYVPMPDVLNELERWNSADGRADHITLAGSGEPTLHAHFGDVFRWTRKNTAVQSVLLTNGTLLNRADVRENAALADKVKVTLSAWDEASFQRIHRPAQGITFELLVQGERAFRELYQGELSVEVFIIDGINSSIEQAKRVAEAVHSIDPERIDINTVIRPPAVHGITAPAMDHLQALAQLFGEKATVTAVSKTQGFTSMDVDENALLSLIRRHPATCSQLAGEFKLNETRMSKTLQRLVSTGVLKAETTGPDTYYVCRSD